MRFRIEGEVTKRFDPEVVTERFDPEVVAVFGDEGRGQYRIIRHWSEGVSDAVYATERLEFDLMGHQNWSEVDDYDDYYGLAVAMARTLIEQGKEPGR